MRDLVASAPKFDALIAGESRERFETLLELLRDAGIDARLNPNLVRGLDYYGHTVFEWTTDRLGAQSAVCAGGRYDGLVREFGVKDGTGVGWALGIERTVALMRALGTAPEPAAPDAFLICTDEVGASEAFALAETVRGLDGAPSLVQDLGGGGMKARFKRADRSGARVALVVGADELAAGEVTVKPLREGADGARADQRRVARDGLGDALREALADAP